MPRILQIHRHFQRIAERGAAIVRPAERPEDDEAPPPEFVTERYAAWSATTATAVYGFVPFSSNNGR